MKKHIPFCLIFSLLIFIGCSSSEDEVSADRPVSQGTDNPDNVVNNSPVVLNQTFNVEENTSYLTVIGKIEASDPDGDSITYLNTIEGISIDEVTGEFTLTKYSPFLLDYETNDSFSFDYTVSDGEVTSSASVTVQIQDLDDGPLKNIEKRIIRSFMFQVQYDETDFPLFKRTEGAKLFLTGSVTQDLTNSINVSTQAYNSMFSDGFEISVVRDSSSSNVTLYSSSVEELESVWPGFYEIALTLPGLGGIAGGDRIWIADYAQNIRTINHEMGHMIGLGHTPAEECVFSEDNSVMCGGVGRAGEDFNEVDIGVIKYYYHPNMPFGLPGTEVENRLEEIILSER